MGLVSELVVEATNSTVPVQDLLRKLKVIAARTQTKELGKWVDHELVGYPSDANLPDYRGPFPMQVYGHFSGPFGAGLQNAPIPPLAFPKEYRDSLFNITFHQPVAELEALARSGKSQPRIEWPADALMLTHVLLREGKLKLDPRLHLNQAYSIVSPSMMSGILDAVRSRILDLSLTLEDTAPAAGEKGASVPSPERMNQIFYNNIYGSSANLAIGSTQVQQSTILPARGDEDALVRALLAANIDQEAVNDLRAALAQDRVANNGVDPPSPGPQVSTWWSRFALKATRGASAIGTAAAGELVAQALASYFGIS